MPRYLSLILLLFASYFGNAQHYKCVYATDTPYFINHNGYLRGIRIDTVITFFTDTVYFPYETRRNTLFPGAKGSWVGSEIRQRPDRTFLFNTIWNDTVIIKTQAQIGDSWEFYADGSLYHYVATVTSVDTMTFAGILDSVKKIKLTAYYGTLINIADSIHNFELILSKHHGFVQLFDFYLFPYHTPSSTAYTMGLDFYQDRLGMPGKTNSIFKRTDFHVPTVKEVYDFEPGDVFITEGWDGNNGWGSSIFSITYDSIISKTTPDPWHVNYTLYRARQWTQAPAWSVPAPTYHHYTAGPGSITADTAKLFSFFTPEQMHSMPWVWYYRPEDVTWCIAGKFYMKDYVVTFEGGPNTFKYRTGLEQVFEETHKYYDSYMFTEHTKLLFTIKNGIPCGERVMPHWVGVDDVSKPKSINIFPNPATNKLYIECSQKMSEVIISDAIGRRMLHWMGNANNAEIDVVEIPPGIYFISIDGHAAGKFTKL